MFGGDGTLNEAINGLMISKTKPKLLYIPTGTVNDVGNYLKISSNYKKALKLLNEKTVLIDVCTINEMYFLYVFACGKFTNISYGGNEAHSKRKLGKFYYYIKAIKEFFRTSKIDFNINDNGYIQCGLLLGLNIGRVGGFRIRRSPNKLNDGKIKVVSFRSTTFFTVIAIGLYLLLGVSIKGMCKEYTGSNFKIKSNQKNLFNADGEESYTTEEVNVKVLKEAIEIFVPKRSVKLYF